MERALAGIPEETGPGKVFVLLNPGSLVPPAGSQSSTETNEATTPAAAATR